jgi:hypothetical protein
MKEKAFSLNLLEYSMTKRIKHRFFIRAFKIMHEDVEEHAAVERCQLAN